LLRDVIATMRIVTPALHELQTSVGKPWIHEQPGNRDVNLGALAREHRTNGIATSEMQITQKVTRNTWERERETERGPEGEGSGVERPGGERR
jgi:hypothetical protein